MWLVLDQSVSIVCSLLSTRSSIYDFLVIGNLRGCYVWRRAGFQKPSITIVLFEDSTITHLKDGLLVYRWPRLVGKIHLLLSFSAGRMKEENWHKTHKSFTFSSFYNATIIKTIIIIFNLNKWALVGITTAEVGWDLDPVVVALYRKHLEMLFSGKQSQLIIFEGTSEVFCGGELYATW